MAKLKRMFPYLMVNALLFYLAPWVIQDTGSDMFISLVVLPLSCLNVAWRYGSRYSFDILFPILTTLLFIPTIFIFYNSSAMIYILIYGGVSMIGNAIGAGLSYHNH